MNSIKQAIFDFKKSHTKVKVKIGSNQLHISIGKETTCLSLTQSALDQCKIVSSNVSKSYSMFEKANGIERHLKANENIFEIVKKLNQVEFIVKKCRKSHIISKSIARNKNYGQKLFAVLRQKTEFRHNNDESHIYEVIPEDIQEQVGTSNMVQIKPRVPKSVNRRKLDNSVVRCLKNVQKLVNELNSKDVLCQLTFKKEIFV